jgi:hypothetical protein
VIIGLLICFGVASSTVVSPVVLMFCVQLKLAAKNRTDNVVVINVRMLFSNNIIKAAYRKDEFYLDWYS